MIMQRVLLSLTLSALLLSACAPLPAIWGVANTPTPNAPETPNIPSDAPDPFFVHDVPIIVPTNTPLILPTPKKLDSSTAVLQPHQVPLDSTPTPAIQPTLPLETTTTEPFLYYAQSGDMLSAVAARFGVQESQIISDADLTSTTMIAPGTLLVIPNRINEPMTPNLPLLPDTELIHSLTAVDFNAEDYVRQQGGYLSKFQDYLGSTGWIEGGKAIQRLAIENSVNPRLLLALLDYESRWVRGKPVDALHQDYPMGFPDYHYKGMTIQMVWAINNMSIAYYGWRAGTITHLVFPDGSRLRIDPRLNAGTVAIQYLFSRVHSRSEWEKIIDPASGFPAMYRQMFGDPWARAAGIPPIFPATLNQPPLTLPFEPNVEWSLTGGPHNAWGQISPAIYGTNHSVYAAIDFAPSTDHGGCDPTESWVTAAAPGLVVRSDNGAVMVDLDGDGYEQTGWNILYMHIAKKDRVSAGTWLEINDHIGHASCEGGVSTGTHLHFARKYNGEWVTADGPIPFIMDGWQVVAGTMAYEGKLVRGDQVVMADPVGQKWSNISRDQPPPPSEEE